MNKKIIFLLLMIFLIGCQLEDKTLEEKSSIEITGSEPIIKEIDEEFDDNLDEALQELEEIESI